MKNKKTMEKIDPKDYVEETVALRSKLHHQFAYEHLSTLLAGILSVIGSLAGVLSSIILFAQLFSDLPQIPQAYASLIGIVVSSIVGISFTFLWARFIYQKRKAEWEEVIRRVRSKERELFEMLDLDFESITRRRDLNAGQTN